MNRSLPQPAQSRYISHERAWQIAGKLPALALLAALGLTGCARGVATTTVHADGSWVRSVTFHGAKPDKDGNTMGTKIEDAFLIPKGQEWKITRQEKEDEVIVTAERTLKPGETLHGDLTLQGSKKQAEATTVNDVTVRMISPGVYKYTETLHWKGALPKALVPDAEAIAPFKSALPPALATDANARELATRSAREIWRVFFGPGDPLVSQLSSMMTQPELVERHLRSRIGADLEKQLAAQFGDQLTAAQRHEAAVHIVAHSLENVMAQTKSKTPGGEKADKAEGDSAPGASLFLSVKMPGRITETNGEQDAFTGDVFWSLYPEAAALGDVTLTATCDTNQKTARK